MYLNAASASTPTSPWKLCMRCIAAIILVLHWAAPVLNAPLKTAADALQDSVEYSVYERDSEPGVISRNAPRASAVQPSANRKAPEFLKSGDKPVAFLCGEAVAPQMQQATTFAATSTFLALAKPSDGFNARAPPPAVA
jgi:hypothetical protein